MTKKNSVDLVDAVALRSFRDQGTGQWFEKDTETSMSRGAFDNYRAAGLVKAAPKKTVELQDPAAKSSTKSA